jgi:hypothetical protein
VFPVRYELDVYILFRRNSLFKGLSTGTTLTFRGVMLHILRQYFNLN